MASQDPPPSLSTNIERGAIPRNSPPSPDEEERLDIHRLQEDAREYRKQLMRTQRATEPASAYRNVLLTEKQINYLLVILKPYVSPIADECRVKLESA